MRVSTSGRFYLSFYAAHFLLGCLSQANAARVSSQRGRGNDSL